MYNGTLKKGKVRKQPTGKSMEKLWRYVENCF